LRWALLIIWSCEGRCPSLRYIALSGLVERITLKGRHITGMGNAHSYYGVNISELDFDQQIAKLELVVKTTKTAKHGILTYVARTQSISLIGNLQF